MSTIPHRITHFASHIAARIAAVLHRAVTALQFTPHDSTAQPV